MPPRRPETQSYKLIVKRGDRRQVGPPQDFESTARALAALFEEGYREVELWVGLTGRRRATARELNSVVAEATKFIAAR